MKRYFNTEGQCEPDLHYMVRLDDRMERIKRLFIDPGKYFVINRGRQYGKTTTLYAMEEYLDGEYLVISMDFQGISAAECSDEYVFVKAFMRLFIEAFEYDDKADAGVVETAKAFAGEGRHTLGEMFGLLSGICRTVPKPVVLMIDEADSASNNQVFIDFLAQLRMYYLKRRKRPIFHSVVLAGVYDIKNLKLKIRPEEEHQYNSPWNIAADFDVDMDFSTPQIAAMLSEYEADNKTGMDTAEIAEEIYRYTSGYPYLVSAICKLLDEKLLRDGNAVSGGDIWTREGVGEAVKIILNSKVPLFESMTKHLDQYPDLRKTMELILYQGEKISFNPYAKSTSLGLMFGYLKNQDGYIVTSNRIFEMEILNMFITEEALDSDAFQCGQRDRNMFIRGSRLDMDKVLEKFVEYFTDICGYRDEEFVEANGRKFFLLYLKPIINGTGNYYIESQTRDAGRTDVIVDYAGEQFIVEMKIWRGNEYNERGERQLAEYLEYYRRTKGYMISFNFNKKKETGVKTVTVGDKTIVEAVV